MPGLYIWVEGADDVRFFENIIVPQLKRKWEWVTVRPYAEIQHSIIRKLLKSVPAGGNEYIFTADRNGAPCPTVRKTKLVEKIDTLDPHRCVVVVQEIESWYLSGLTTSGCKVARVKEPKTTDHVTKEACLKQMHGSFTSRVAWLQLMLDHFDIETAKRKNESFRYFCTRYKI